jgi:hypothetical protein
MHGAIPFDRQRHEALRGVSRRRSLELLLAGRVYPEEQMLALMERKNRYYQALLKQVTPAGPVAGGPSLAGGVACGSLEDCSRLGQSERPRGGAAAAPRVL